MAEDKEVELMVAFLEVKIDLNQLSKLNARCAVHAPAEQIDRVLETVTKNKAYLRRLTYKNLLDHLETAEMKTPQISFIKGLPENYADFYRKYFNTPCKYCEEPGITSICLLCGDCLCTMSCGFEHDETDSRCFGDFSRQRDDPFSPMP